MKASRSFCYLFGSINLCVTPPYKRNITRATRPLSPVRGKTSTDIHLSNPPESTLRREINHAIWQVAEEYFIIR